MEELLSNDAPLSVQGTVFCSAAKGCVLTTQRKRLGARHCCTGGAFTTVTTVLREAKDVEAARRLSSRPSTLVPNRVPGR
jgi:hypothetical protein